MAIKIKMELTDDEAEALLGYHAARLIDPYKDQLATAARIHDIAKRIQRARDSFAKEPETQKAPIAAAWPNS